MLKKCSTLFYTICMKTKKTEKNICETFVRGQKKYLVSITTPQKKRIKRYFNTISEARHWLKNYKFTLGIDVSDFALLSPERLADIRASLKKIPPHISFLELTDFALLSPERLADIRTALNNLPDTISITECVNAYNPEIVNVPMPDAINEFLRLKDGAVSQHYYADIRNQLTKFQNVFAGWKDAEPHKIVSFCKSISTATKTQRHYFGTLREFFDFAETKSYCKNPFNKIHKSEIPKVQRTSISVPTPADIKIFFERLETMYPKLVGLYALVAFGGIRLAEAQRLTSQSFDLNRNEITLPFKDSKTRQNWLQANMPNNVWEWLKKYPVNDAWKIGNPDIYAKRAKDGLNFPPNALRHSFATYHLSLYREANKTQILMRHTSSAMLWQTYLAGLTSKEVAIEYFNIVPK